MGASQSMDTDSKKQDSIDKKMASGYGHKSPRRSHKMSGHHHEEHGMSGHHHGEHGMSGYHHKMSASEAQTSVKGMHMRKCKVDPKLASQKGRKSPPIKASECKVGSVARGLDGRMYVNSGKRWTPACKTLSDAAVARLDKPKRARKAASPKRAKRTRKAASPKRNVKKSPAKTPKRRPRKVTTKKK